MTAQIIRPRCFRQPLTAKTDVVIRVPLLEDVCRVIITTAVLVLCLFVASAIAYQLGIAVAMYRIIGL